MTGDRRPDHGAGSGCSKRTDGGRLAFDGGNSWGHSQDGAQQAGPNEEFCNNCGSAVNRNAEICPNCGINRGQQRVQSRQNNSGTQYQEVTTAGEEPSGRYISGFIGGLVGFFVGLFIPVVGHVGGGVIAGYLRGKDTKESGISGAVAGAVAAIPGLLVVLPFMFIFVIGGLAGGSAEAAAGGLMFVLILGAIVVFAIAIVAGFGALGGVIGAEFSDRRAP